MLMATDAYSTLVMASSPVAYYRLDDSTTTIVDSSSNGLAMAAGASVTLGSAGLLSPSVSSDAAITIPSTPATAVGLITETYAANALQVTTGLTIELWCKPTTIGNNTYIVIYGSNAASAYGLGITGANMYFGYIHVTTSGNQYPGSTAAIAAGNVYHMALTYTSGTCNLFLNGVLNATGAYTGTVTGYTTPYALTIGNTADFIDPNFNGVVDELAVYSTALTPAVIRSHFATGIAGAVLAQVATSGAFSATGFAAALGASPTANNTLLIGCSTYTAGAFTTPGGWTLVASGTSGTEHLYVYGKISAGTETSVTITATSPHGNWAYLEFSNGPALISSLVAGTAVTASTTTATASSSVTPTTATGTVVSFHGAMSTSALTGLTVTTSSQLTAQAAFAATTSFGSIAVDYSQAALPASAYSETGTWSASCTSLVSIQVWIPSPIPPSWPTPYNNYQRAAILAQ
jgi:hypothetical protein